MKKKLLFMLFAILISGIFVNSDRSVSALERTENNWWFHDMNVQEAHDLEITGKGVRIAVIDSGIFTGAESEFNVIKQVDCTSGSCFDLTDNNLNIHGTNVASMITMDPRETDGNPGGIAPDAEIYSARILDDGNLWESYGQEPLVSAIQWAINENVNIINMSIDLTYSITNELETAISDAYNQGIILIAGTGNDGISDETYYTENNLSEHSKIISVGAIDINHNRWLVDPNSTEYEEGKFTGSATSIKIDFGIPGDDVKGFNNNILTGTSFATPILSGLTALIKQTHPDATPQEVKEYLISLSKNLNGYKDNYWDVEFGHGLPIIDVNNPIFASKIFIPLSQGITFPEENTINIYEHPKDTAAETYSLSDEILERNFVVDFAYEKANDKLFNWYRIEVPIDGEMQYKWIKRTENDFLLQFESYEDKKIYNTNTISSENETGEVLSVGQVMVKANSSIRKDGFYVVDTAAGEKYITSIFMQPGATRDILDETITLTRDYYGYEQPFSYSKKLSEIKPGDYTIIKRIGTWIQIDNNSVLSWINLGSEKIQALTDKDTYYQDFYLDGALFKTRFVKEENSMLSPGTYEILTQSDGYFKIQVGSETKWIDKKDTIIGEEKLSYYFHDNLIQTDSIISIDTEITLSQAKDFYKLPFDLTNSLAGQKVGTIQATKGFNFLPDRERFEWYGFEESGKTYWISPTDNEVSEVYLNGILDKEYYRTKSLDVYNIGWINTNNNDPNHTRFYPAKGKLVYWFKEEMSANSIFLKHYVYDNTNTDITFSNSKNPDDDYTITITKDNAGEKLFSFGQDIVFDRVTILNNADTSAYINEFDLIGSRVNSDYLLEDVNIPFTMSSTLRVYDKPDRKLPFTTYEIPEHLRQTTLTKGYGWKDNTYSNFEYFLINIPELGINNKWIYKNENSNINRPIYMQGLLNQDLITNYANVNYPTRSVLDSISWYSTFYGLGEITFTFDSPRMISHAYIYDTGRIGNEFPFIFSFYDENGIELGSHQMSMIDWMYQYFPFNQRYENVKSVKVSSPSLTTVYLTEFDLFDAGVTN